MGPMHTATVDQELVDSLSVLNTHACPRTKPFQAKRMLNGTVYERQLRSGVVVHTCNPSTWENHMFEASLGYTARLYLKKKKKHKGEKDNYNYAPSRAEVTHTPSAEWIHKLHFIYMAEKEMISSQTQQHETHITVFSKPE